MLNQSTSSGTFLFLFCRKGSPLKKFNQPKKGCLSFSWKSTGHLSGPACACFPVWWCPAVFDWPDPSCSAAPECAKLKLQGCLARQGRGSRVVVKTVLGSHFGVGAPPVLGYFCWAWDVHWGYGLLTRGQMPCPELAEIGMWGASLVISKLGPSVKVPEFVDQ